MMSFSIRIFLGYFLILSLAAGLMLHTHVNTVQPAMRQTVEDALADTAYLLSVALAAQITNDRLQVKSVQQLLNDYQTHPSQALIWGVSKQTAGYRIYVTDSTGKVIADTDPTAIGADYSRWNDVYLTLQNQYGARATREVAADDDASTLYVAAPVKDAQNKITAVVSVGRNVKALQPYVDGIRANIFLDAALMLSLALSLAALFSGWISISVRRVAYYAQAISQGRRDVSPPEHGPREIRMLGEAVDAMRKHLEGKAYVEQYVHALTHALKSPLAGMQANLELLEDPLNEADKRKLLSIAQHEARRMQDSIERLLQLARLEQQQGLQNHQTLDIVAIVRSVVDGAQPILAAKAIQCELQTQHADEKQVAGEAALIHLALDSLLANALAFTPKGGKIKLYFVIAPPMLLIKLFNSGPLIPDYALPRVFERFFSLPRPDSGQRSSGLGLSLAREIALLHGGDLTLANEVEGVTATLSLPAS